MQDCFPDKTQEQLYSMPPHFQILLKAPLKTGPRRLPRSLAPTARFIEI